MDWKVRKKLVVRGKYKIIATVKRGFVQIGTKTEMRQALKLANPVFLQKG